MRIIDRYAKRVALRKAVQPDGNRGLSPEQWAIVEALEAYRYVLILKPRQIGSTTITQGWAFHYGWKCKDPISILTMTHESGACTRVNQMLRNYWRGLPRALRPVLATDNNSCIEFQRETPDGEEAQGITFRQYMAGGRGQGRAYTYDVAIFTEMGLYPQGSASVNGGTEADRDAVASVLSTMHDGPHKKVVIESTGDGPSGMFYDMVKTARRSPEWAFLFFRWYDFPHYAVDPPPEWERTEEERDIGARIADRLGIDENDPTIDRRLAWRRRKLVDEGYSALRFRREYPETWQDPFLLTESTWFDSELLNRVLAKLPPGSSKATRVYLEAEAGRRYFIGMDTSGGVGKDDSVVVVIRDDFEVCAVWSSNTSTLLAQAEMASRLSAFYSPADAEGEVCRAPILCEKNKYGATVIAHLKELRARIWTDRKGNDFWMQGGPAGETKHMVYAHAQRLVNHMHACSAARNTRPLINDPRILQQLIIVREDDKGNVQAPAGEHDDHADAYVLALWCARGYYTISTAPPPTKGAVQAAIRRQLRGQ